MKSILYLIIIVIPFNILAQKPTDTELWTGGTINFKLTKRFALDVSEQVRFDNNISSYKKSFTNIGLKIKLNKHFSLKPSYRFIALPISTFDHRVSLDGYYKWKKKKIPLSFSYRMRFQHQFVSSKSYLRNKLTMGYNLSKLVDPFFAYEIFFRFNGKNEFRVSRFTLGLDWKINKRVGLTSYYRLQDDIFIKKPKRQHIIGIMLNYKIKSKKR